MIVIIVNVKLRGLRDDMGGTISILVMSVDDELYAQIHNMRVYYQDFCVKDQPFDQYG